MNEYLILAAGMILLPGIYICLTFWQTEKFNGMSKFEVIVLAAAEIAFLRMWRTDSRLRGKFKPRWWRIPGSTLEIPTSGTPRSSPGSFSPGGCFWRTPGPWRSVGAQTQRLCGRIRRPFTTGMTATPGTR